MASDLNFNANDVKPNTRPDPMPNGDYRLAIVKSDIEPTKNGKGKMLKLEIAALDEPYKGQRIFEQLCIQHESEKTQSIAQGQLSAICHATGVLKLTNSSQLHNIPFIGRVRIEQDPGYDPKNVIKSYKPIAGAVPAASNGGAAATSAAQSTQPATPATSAAAPAWARKAG